MEALRAEGEERERAGGDGYYIASPRGGERLRSSERIAKPIKYVFDVLLPNSKSDTLSHTAMSTFETQLVCNDIG